MLVHRVEVTSIGHRLCKLRKGIRGRPLPVVSDTGAPDSLFGSDSCDC